MNVHSMYKYLNWFITQHLTGEELNEARNVLDTLKGQHMDALQPSPAPAAGITFFYDGGDPFICEVHESCTLDDLEGIQNDVLDLVDEYMDKGHGLYTFSSKWVPEESDLGYITNPGYWEMQLLNWQPLPAPPQADEVCEQINIRSLFAEIAAWRDKTFPNRTEETILNHLRDEVNTELHEGCEAEEIADCILLLIGYSEFRGIDPWEEVSKKFQKNLARKWEWNEEIGTFTHIKDDTGKAAEVSRSQVIGICRTCDTDIEHDGFRWNHCLKMLDAEHAARPKGSSNSMKAEVTG